VIASPELKLMVKGQKWSSQFQDVTILTLSEKATLDQLGDLNFMASFASFPSSSAEIFIR